MSPTARADYGLDAPGVVRNLVIAACSAWGVFLSSALGLWSGVVGPTESVMEVRRIGHLAVAVGLAVVT